MPICYVNVRSYSPGEAANVQVMASAVEGKVCGADSVTGKGLYQM